jgi:hypothetical protein
MITNLKTIRRPQKVIEIDESVTKVVVKRRVQGIKIEDESSEKHYIIQRTVKNGLQMTGA